MPTSGRLHNRRGLELDMTQDRLLPEHSRIQEINVAPRQHRERASQRPLQMPGEGIQAIPASQKSFPLTTLTALPVLPSLRTFQAVSV